MRCLQQRTPVSQLHDTVYMVSYIVSYTLYYILVACLLSGGKELIYRETLGLDVSLGKHLTVMFQQQLIIDQGSSTEAMSVCICVLTLVACFCLTDGMSVLLIKPKEMHINLTPL